MDDTHFIIQGHPRHARQRGTFRPIYEGWALDAMGALDEAHPGFLRHAFRAKPAWRQSVFLALSTGILPNPDEFLLRANGVVAGERCWRAVQQDLSECLMAMTPRQIMEATLGEVPDGLAGSLAKLGSQPMRHAGDYIRLVGLLTATDAEGRLRAKTLLQIDRLGSDLISAVLEIDAIALIPGVFRRVRDDVEARRLNQRLAAIRLVCSTASDEALRQSLEDRASDFSASRFAQAWLEKADRPPVFCAALDEHEDFQTVTPATAASFGKEYSNCLGSKAHRLIDGTWGAWLWKPGPLFVCVTNCHEGPLLTGLYSAGNREVEQELSRRLKDILRPLGVICFTRSEPLEEVRPLTFGRFADPEFDEFGFE